MSLQDGIIIRSMFFIIFRGSPHGLFPTRPGIGGRRCPLDFKQACFPLVDTISDLDTMAHEEHWNFERNGYALIMITKISPLLAFDHVKLK